jgi:deazaflavin-dependent oxidoreductase (nitroreductase family)
MPIPRFVARLNRVALNPVMRLAAGRMPPLAIIHHTGRTSGELYRTPIMVFRTDSGFVIALTYGPGTDWQHNLEEAGSANLVYRGRTYRITTPRLVHGSPDEQPLPRVVRAILRRLRITDYLYVTAQPGEG